MTEMPHVVVVGGGLRGVCRRPASLAKEGFRVTLIDRHPYNTFQPLLYQVATGGLNAGDVTYSLRYFAARLPRRQLPSDDRHRHRSRRAGGASATTAYASRFDYLILGNGITTNHFGIPGAAEYSDVDVHPGRGAPGARHDLRQHRDHRRPVRPEHTGGFTVVVVGGGATGVEIAGQLAELKSHDDPGRSSPSSTRP